MNNRNKGKAKYSLAWLCVMLFVILTYCSTALNQDVISYRSVISQVIIDSPPVKPAKILPINPSKSIIEKSVDSIKIIADTTIKTKVDTFSFRISKDTLSGPIVSHAEDSMILDVPTKKVYLYGKESTIKYTDNELSAPEIEFDHGTSLVKAHLVKDSTGKVINYVSYNQGDGFKSVMDSLVLNMKTLRGITKGTYTQQGEMFVYGEKIKKEDKDVFYALNSRFTTCNLDTPHFAFVSHKIKFISQKMAFSGPVHPEFEGVPVPIVLPFGIYPLSQGRRSGLLSPTFTSSAQYGIGLEDLGYYRVFNDNWDVITRGSLFSYGGWKASINPRYFKRYHYQGNLSFDYLKTKPLDESSLNTFKLTWSHSMDNKARPGVRFTAYVNAGSTKYNSSVPSNTRLNYDNQMSSSISYSKYWKDKPYDITINANHNQNTTSKMVNLNIPDVAFNVQTLYPFRKKESIGEYKWYENLGIALNTSTKSFTSFYDTAKNIGQQIKDNFQWGASHSVPISLSLPPMGVFQVSPSVSYSERWYMQQMERRWDDVSGKQDIIIQNGFYSAREMTFGIGATTRIFGMFGFNPKSKVKAIRHEIRPSISANYKPDMSKNYYYYAYVNAAKDSALYSKYENSVYGSFGSGEFGGMNFSLDNNISMKVRNRKDTSESATKKIVLIDGLRLDAAYNFLADSFRLSPINISARSNLFEKINITAGATLDPYQRNENGRRLDRLVWKDKILSLGRVSNANISVNSAISGGEKKDKNKGSDQADMVRRANRSGMPVNEYEIESEYMRNNPGEFVDFDIPWSIDFGYSLRYDAYYVLNQKVPVKNFNQDLNMNASVNLTPKWKLGVNGSFNITRKELGMINMYLSREMHCWQMTINISRSDQSRYFTINISPKSSILRDLKVNRTRYFIGN